MTELHFDANFQLITFSNILSLFDSCNSIHVDILICISQNWDLASLFVESDVAQRIIKWLLVVVINCSGNVRDVPVQIIF